MAQPIDLPNDCALIAASACSQLARNGVQARALAVVYKLRPLRRHIIVVFEFDGRLRGYDRDGSTTLSRSVSFADNPTKIARAWKLRVGREFPFKVIRAVWY